MDFRFVSLLALASVAGLGILGLAAPNRPDLLEGAAAGAGFGGALAVAGYEVVRRAAVRSPQRAVRLFLAVMTAKVLAFAAFLLVVAFTMHLDAASYGGGLAAVTVVGEALTIEGLRRRQKERRPAATAGGRPDAQTGGGESPASRAGISRKDERTT